MYWLLWELCSIFSEIHGIFNQVPVLIFGFAAWVQVYKLGSVWDKSINYFFKLFPGKELLRKSLKCHSQMALNPWMIYD